MIYLLYTIHVIVCIFLILVVLLQQGKGADLSVFGVGSTQAAFGARGATTLLQLENVTVRKPSPEPSVVTAPAGAHLRTTSQVALSSASARSR